MAYSELIKDFSRIRAYMREFYVYGFRNRDEVGDKSARSYDNERRRIESWLGEYMRFRQDESGKQVFLSMDSRTLPHNPMYEAFRARSFTDLDLTLHFCLLDLLRGRQLTAREVTDLLADEMVEETDAFNLPDESTVRRKLKEYEVNGLLSACRRGREVVYTVAEDTVDAASWQEAVSFFMEDAPLGVIGSYFHEERPSVFGFKHRGLLDVLDSEIMLELLQCMQEQRAAELIIFSRRRREELVHTLVPLRFFLSTQTGRQYLLGYHKQFKKPVFFRLDGIRKVKKLEKEENAELYLNYVPKLREHLWGVSTGVGHQIHHIEMDVHAGAEEGYIVDRLHREKRCGQIEQLDECTWRFSADVYDAIELLPWLRTFIGRIDRLSCSDRSVEQRFYEDLTRMSALYGGEPDAVQ